MDHSQFWANMVPFGYIGNNFEFQTLYTGKKTGVVIPLQNVLISLTKYRYKSKCVVNRVPVG